MVDDITIGDRIPINDLDIVWPMLVPYIQNIADNYAGDSVSDTRRMLDKGSATLHFYGEVGFVIFQWMPGLCHVRAAGTYNRRPLNRVKCIKAAIAYAKQFGCERLTLCTCRKGLGRVVTRLGMEEMRTTYGIDI